LAKPYFPRGRAVVGLLDALAQHNWVPCAAPNFGGPIGDKASADWPSIILSQDGADQYTQETLFLAVKDQNVPGKLCAAGPQEAVSALKQSLTPRLQGFSETAKCEFDSYDTEEHWDAVWANTSLTSGAAAFSFAKPYFPKGNVVLAILEEVYKLGWRLVAAPNFGGNDVDWPCLIFRQLKEPGEPPALLMGAIKDQNVPGKLCLAGAEASAAAEALKAALLKVKGNDGVEIKKDEYDGDWSEVLRNTKLTTGTAAFSFKLAFFPKSDSTLAMLGAMNELGWSVAACPNFGGMGATWPTYIWEKRGASVASAMIAIKDQNVPGKVCFGGPLAADGVQEHLLSGFRALAGDAVECRKDKWDETYDMCFCNTKMTSGSVPCSMQNAWWPFGFPLEMALSELRDKGWRAVGGPNYGAGQLSWSVVILERDAAVPVPVMATIA